MTFDKILTQFCFRTGFKKSLDCLYKAAASSCFNVRCQSLLTTLIPGVENIFKVSGQYDDLQKLEFHNKISYILMYKITPRTFCYELGK